MAVKIEVFDPPMCCSSGVCGPNVNKALPRFASDLDWLKLKGATVERYNLARDLHAFASNVLVKGLLSEKGDKCLPLILVDGKIVSEGNYPSRAELAKFAGIDVSIPSEARRGTTCWAAIGASYRKVRQGE